MGNSKANVTPALRSAVAALPAYVPGARADDRPMWKLSSNENPNPPLPGLLDVLTETLAGLNRYPDMQAGALREALAARHGVTPEQIATGNGSVAVLGHVLAAFVEPGDEVVYPWRSFEAYPILAGVAGATSVQIPNRPDGSHDLAALAKVIGRKTRIVILCSPNNPTGTALGDAELREFLAKVPPRVLVVLDEAYVEYVTREDAADGLALLRAFPNLILLRTFSKAYGLAGLRVGYAIGPAPLIAGVQATSTPFGTNLVAQAAALEVLQRQPEVFERVWATIAERERVVTAVRAAGWEVPEAQGNFFWLPLGDRSADFAAAASDAGLLVRAFAGDGVRVTVAEPEANDAVVALLQEWTA